MSLYRPLKAKEKEDLKSCKLVIYNDLRTQHFYYFAKNYTLFHWKALIFPIFCFSLRAKAAMWLWNIIGLCRDRKFSILLFRESV